MVVVGVGQYQAVVLAGGSGSRMHPLTEEGSTKAILPIANRPMIHYALSWLEKSGFTEVLVVAQQSDKKLVRYIKENYESGSLMVELVLLQDPTGTADALRAVAHKIRSDFIVVSSDLVTDAPLHKLVEVHRLNDATVTALFSDAAKIEAVSEDSTKGRSVEDIEFVGLDEKRENLLLLTPKADIDESLRVRSSAMRRHTSVTIHTNLKDAHAYIFSKWVIDLVVAKKNIYSIKGELLPLLIKCQNSPATAASEIGEVLGLKISLHEENHHLQGQQGHHRHHHGHVHGRGHNHNHHHGQVHGHGHGSAHGNGASESAAKDTDAHRPLIPSDSAEGVSVSCFVYIHTTGYCSRSNTTSAYSEINRQIAKGACAMYAVVDRIGQATEISSKSQVGTECIVGNGSKIGDRSSAKKSIIGSHCQVGSNVKLVNVVLMDYAVVEDGCKLEGVIVSRNARVEQKSTLKDCDVATSVVVKAETNGKSEAFTNSRGMEESD